MTDGPSNPRRRALLLFWDGVGYGRKSAVTNPFFQAKLPHLLSLTGGAVPHLRHRHIASDVARVVPLNATLRTPGLPQSGTGQATLFTGVNASRLIGRHFGPHPTTTLHPLIESKNIFRQSAELGKSRCFANAFPRQFFEYAAVRSNRLSVSTLSCRYAGLELLDGDSLRRDEAISADITRGRWADLGYPEIAAVTPRVAGHHLWKISQRFSLTIFEYWLTDYAGHARDMAHAVEVLERFDGLLGGLLEHFDPSESTLVITSDHGNVEDLSTKSHTRAPVPCIVAGRQREEFSSNLRDLTHVTPALLSLL